MKFCKKMTFVSIFVVINITAMCMIIYKTTHSPAPAPTGDYTHQEAMINLALDKIFHDDYGSASSSSVAETTAGGASLSLPLPRGGAVVPRSNHILPPHTELVTTVSPDSIVSNAPPQDMLVRGKDAGGQTGNRGAVEEQAGKATNPLIHPLTVPVVLEKHDDENTNMESGEVDDSAKVADAQEVPDIGTDNELGTTKTEMVLILTESRSGSSWLLDLLSYPENTLAFFEPLNTAFYKATKLSKETEDGINPAHLRLWRQTILSRICSCNFFGQKGGRKDLGSVNGYNWKYARQGIHLTSSKQVLEKCHRQDVLQIAKTIRLYNISELEILEKEGCKDFKIVHLVRDPRAVLLSRMITFHELYDGNHILGAHIKGGQESFSEEYVRKAARDLCSHALYNYRLGSDRSSWLKDRYYLQKYEDTAQNPDKYARLLFRYIGEPYTRSVQNYVYESSHPSGPNSNSAYSVKKESAKVVGAWHNKLKSYHQKYIEEECAELMAVMGYEREYPLT